MAQILATAVERTCARRPKLSIDTLPAVRRTPIQPSAATTTRIAGPAMLAARCALPNGKAGQPHGPDTKATKAATPPHRPQRASTATTPKAGMVNRVTHNDSRGSRCTCQPAATMMTPVAIPATTACAIPMPPMSSPSEAKSGQHSDHGAGQGHGHGDAAQPQQHQVTPRHGRSEQDQAVGLGVRREPLHGVVAQGGEQHEGDGRRSPQHPVRTGHIGHGRGGVGPEAPEQPGGDAQADDDHVDGAGDGGPGASGPQSARDREHLPRIEGPIARRHRVRSQTAALPPYRACAKRPRRRTPPNAS